MPNDQRLGSTAFGKDSPWAGRRRAIPADEHRQFAPAHVHRAMPVSFSLHAPLPVPIPTADSPSASHLRSIAGDSSSGWASSTARDASSDFPRMQPMPQRRRRSGAGPFFV